jgi:hypothetical protein
MERLAVERHRLLPPRQRHAGQRGEEAALNSERVWRERRRTDTDEQALFLRSLRGDPHCAAAGGSNYVAVGGLSAVCVAAVAAGWHGSDQWHILPAQPQEEAFYRNMFGLYSNTAGTPTPVLSCPLDANGALLAGAQTAANLFNGSGCANKRTQSLNNSDSENLIVLKIDHTIDANDTVWYRFQQDTGLQAAYTDPINAIFNSYSPQPSEHWSQAIRTFSRPTW